MDIQCTSEYCPLFHKFRKMLFLLSLDIFKNSNQNFYHMLSPGQTITTCQRNISQHCWAQHVTCVWPPCCDMLRRVGCSCWLKFGLSNLSQQQPTCHSISQQARVTKRLQYVVPNNVANYMLYWYSNVLIVWPGL